MTVVSPRLFRENCLQLVEQDFIEKMICHEMAHRLHIRILNGDEEAMGPVWFYEGFAIYAADQYASSLPELSEEDIWAIVRDSKRGDYRNYAAVGAIFLNGLVFRNLLVMPGTRTSNSFFARWHSPENRERPANFTPRRRWPPGVGKSRGVKYKNS